MANAGPGKDLRNEVTVLQAGEVDVSCQGCIQLDASLAILLLSSHA